MLLDIKQKFLTMSQNSRAYVCPLKQYFALRLHRMNLAMTNTYVTESQDSVFSRKPSRQ